MEREPNILVAGPEEDTSFVAHALRERGLRCWTDRSEHVLHDDASLTWADVLVLFHEPHLIASVRQELVRFTGPKVLLAPASADIEHVDLLEEDGFEYVLDWPAPEELLAAHVERAIHRRVLLSRYRAAV